MRKFVAVCAVFLTFFATITCSTKCSERSTAKPNSRGDYDFIIVGAGAGGAPTASRLSEQFKVLLLENGPKIYDDATKNSKIVDSLLVGNDLPEHTGDVILGDKKIGVVNEDGQIVSSSGEVIGEYKKAVPYVSKPIFNANGKSLFDRAVVINQKPNPKSVPHGSAFGLHMQKTPFMVPYMSMSELSHFYNTVPQVYSQKREITYPRGNMVGGSTGTNWMVYFKGTRRDFDEIWRDELGLEGWGYDDVEPYFRKFENCTDCKHLKDGSKHGYDGPIKTSLSRSFFDYPALDAWHQAALKLGWPDIDDANDPENQYGSSNDWFQFVSDTGRRSDATDYIALLDQKGLVCWDTPTENCAENQNLHIWTEKFVTKVIINKETRRAEGVEFVDAKKFQYGARTEHPNFPQSENEGVKHRHPFNKWDSSSMESEHGMTMGAPVNKKIALDYKNLKGQYIPQKHDLKGHIQSVFAKKEVILSAGAVGTAQILMLSGVGPKNHLRELNIPLIYDLPVGQHLLDHMEVGVFYRFGDDYEQHIDFLKEAQEGNPSLINWHQGQKKSFFSSNHVVGGLEGSSEGPHSTKKVATYHLHHIAFGILENADFHLSLTEISSKAPHRIPRNVLEFFGWLGPRYHQQLCELSSNHAIGTIHLRSNDPLAQPFVDPRYGSSEEDIYELVSCVKEVRRIMENADPKYVGEEVGPCVDAKTDEELVQCVRNIAWGHHISGSAPMGTCQTDYAVTDNKARVYGIEGLRVVDISLFPDIPHGNPTGVIFMMAEKLSDEIKEEYSSPQKDSKDHKEKDAHKKTKKDRKDKSEL